MMVELQTTYSKLF